MSLVLKFLKNLLFEIVPPVQTVSNEKKNYASYVLQERASSLKMSSYLKKIYQS